MNNVIDFQNYKIEKRRDWLNKHNAQLDRFIGKFLGMNVRTDYPQVSSFYQAHKYDNSESSWDYSELREKIRDGLEDILGDALYESLQAQWWFEQKFVRKEEVIDRCLSTYILGSFRSVSGD